MTLSFYPFDNQDTSESQYSYLFRELQDSGVAGSPTTNAFQVVADGTAMRVRVQPGFAILRGHAVLSTGIEDVLIATANSVARTDVIVLTLDPTANTILLGVVKGLAGGTIPALTQTDTGVWQLPLAYVTVGANVTNITAAAVTTDTRRFLGTRVGTWTTALRPTNPRTSQLGWNRTLLVWEFWDGTSWTPLTPKNINTQASLNINRLNTMALMNVDVVAMPNKMRKISGTCTLTSDGASGLGGVYRWFISPSANLPAPVVRYHPNVIWYDRRDGNGTSLGLYYKSDEATWFIVSPDNLILDSAPLAGHIMALNFTYEAA